MQWSERFENMCGELHISDEFLKLCFKECIFRVFGDKDNKYRENKELVAKWFGDVDALDRVELRKAVFGTYFGGNQEKVLDLAGSWSNDLADIIDEVASEDVFDYIFKKIKEDE